MKILVIGSGGREHALVWKISQSQRATKIYCAPGNGGIEELAQCVDIKSDDIDELLKFALEEEIDLTIVGPEAPLVKGIVDRFIETGLNIIGPSKNGALLEGSKIYAKEFMLKYGIPTAQYMNFSDAKDAIEALEEFQYPLVIKADGLAAGKGVIICNNKDEAVEAIINILKNKKFGSAGHGIVIEEYLQGTEISLLCFLDGKSIIPMEGARDYKRAFDGDKGPNTGGMGCFSPNPLLNDKLLDKVKSNILSNISKGLKEEGIDYKGILFIGLMITDKGPMVLEFNVRMGDPETEVVLPRLESDLIEIFTKILKGELHQNDLKWTNQSCATVILASGGYPESYSVGKKITGLDTIEEDTLIFNCGTKKVDNELFTNGGRVLGVTALGENLEKAIDKAYKNIKKIDFQDCYYRQDVGR